MPHVGGGSNSGGFHSGGSSGSTSIRSIPKTDVYGNAHSKYYLYPGFYYHGVYVPYSRVHRRYNAIRSYLIFMLISLAIIGMGIASIFVTKYDEALEDYSLDRYSDVYKHDKNYEYNIMIEIIAYDNQKEIDYLPIVGDEVAKDIDNMFGNQKTIFGGNLAENIRYEDNKVKSLYNAIAQALDLTNNSISKSYYSNNTYSTKIINRTKFDLGDDTKLMEEMEEFYTLTGYNIIIDINNYKSAYHPNYPFMIIFFCMGSFLLVYSVYHVFKSLNAVKMINIEDEKGNLEEYYEGEIFYEDQVKKYSMDEPYKYNRAEYDELKKEYEKEFEIDKSKFEIDKEDYESEE